MNKMLIAAAASSVLLLAGCASGPDEATTAKMNEISTQVSELNSQVAALASKWIKLLKQRKPLKKKLHALTNVSTILLSLTLSNL